MNRAEVLEHYPSGQIPTVEKNEQRIAELTAQRTQKNSEYQAASVKSKELSEAKATIEQYLHQEQSKEQQKKKKRNDLE